MKIFKLLHDVDSDVTYWREVSSRRFHFIVIEYTDDWPEDCDRSKKYLCNLLEVDLNLIPESEQKKAGNSCGYCHLDDIDPDLHDAVTAHWCLQYGLFARVIEMYENNQRTCLRHAKWVSKRMESDSEYSEQMLSNVVNKIGTTAKEMMCGDIYSAMARAQTPEAKLIGNMYLHTGGQTLGGYIGDDNMAKVIEGQSK